MRSPDESRPGATNTEAAATTKGAEVTSSVVPKLKLKHAIILAMPTPAQWLVGIIVGAITFVVVR